ncbi:hypothetical protein CGMCC3_g16952 [Colletotrichum fructicola]|nr:uncharacterized protein CGMCC3_g16952 [Colletotrichum fructicola]KAE9566885.1 hypothetical protein CGMCC3_g16952 [Colletotrichum fructicola]
MHTSSKAAPPGINCPNGPRASGSGVSLTFSPRASLAPAANMILQTREITPLSGLLRIILDRDPHGKPLTDSLGCAAIDLSPRRPPRRHALKHDTLSHSSSALGCDPF